MKLDELYDVVDRNDNVIGQATWSECHTKGLLHRGVHGLVFKDTFRKSILLRKRSLLVWQEPGVYEIAVAGHVLSGESPDKGILRECEEELFGGGHVPKDLILKKICRYFNNDISNNHEIIHLYEIIYPGRTKRDLESQALSKWVSWESLAKDIQLNPANYAQFTINAISEYLKNTQLHP